MDAFFKYFYQDIGQIIRELFTAVGAIFNAINFLLNFPMRAKLIKSYQADFTIADWIMLILANLCLIALIVMGIFAIALFLKKALRFRIPIKEYDKMKADLKRLTRDVLKLNYEKDKILAMKIAELGFSPVEDLLDIKEPNLGQEEGTPNNASPAVDENGEPIAVANPNRNTIAGPPVDPLTSRFFRLTTVDNYYKQWYQEPEYDNEIQLDEFCERYRNFAASRLGLYYDISIIRFFIASLGAARIIILQGISGTGKTSLPYSFGKYVQLDTTIAAVQPAWRERTELFGYFNEFTKKFNETDFLRAVYEANYYKDPHIVVLDEMNIARVEYYFAEMLSTLEMPRSSEWLIDIVTAEWDNDPCLIKNNKVHINDNTWFVGTINNDDSTFAVADKVYDRAIPIDLDSKAVRFEAPDTPPVHVTSQHLMEMFDEAKKKYPLSEEMMKKIDLVDAYVIQHFRLAFGNRIMRQIRLFVPCYIACGGTEIDAVDFIIAKKVLRKFESLSLGYMGDELRRFTLFLDKTFGKQNMGICKEYISRLEKMQ